MKNASALKAIAEVEVDVAVKLAETSLSLGEILELRPGTTLSFAEKADESLSLEVDGVTVGRGHAVQRKGQLGFMLEALKEDRAANS